MRQIFKFISMGYDFGKILVFSLCQNSDMQKQRITQLIITKIRHIIWLGAAKQISI